jgi:broad specificity phosphatase PhoE
MKNLLFFFALALVFASCTSQNQPKTIYIVRHGERILEGKDPELAHVGQVRAKKLAQILENENIKHIFSTDYQRTRLTAWPTAVAAGVEIESYDPGDHDALVAKLRELEGNTLVVGHSNTISRLANYFVGDGEKFADLTDLEYEYIYIVTLKGNSSSVIRKVYKDF